MTSHGFRWFQINDDFQLAYNTNGTAGYQSDDIYQDVDTENNLFGYQFGSRLSYCINCRWSLNVGGKFGLYGNRAELRHRVGDASAAAYRNGVSADLIDTHDTDTVLATLGELDLGLAYRLGKRVDRPGRLSPAGRDRCRQRGRLDPKQLLVGRQQRSRSRR